jgi:hypothetical protein
MSYELDKEGTLALKAGESVVRLRYRRPTLAELIETLVKKMPRGDETADANRILHANLELGRACLRGVALGDLAREGRPLVTDPGHPQYMSDWKEMVAARAPLLLVALGQYLSAAPAFLEGPALKKADGMPA